MSSLLSAVRDDAGRTRRAESTEEHLRFLFMSKIKPSELLRREVDMYSTGSWSGANREQLCLAGCENVIVSSVRGSIVTGSLHHISHYIEKSARLNHFDVSLCLSAVHFMDFLHFLTETVGSAAQLCPTPKASRLSSQDRI